MSWRLHGGIWISTERADAEIADAREKQMADLSMRVAVLEKEIDDMKLEDTVSRLGTGKPVRPFVRKRGQRFG